MKIEKEFILREIAGEYIIVPVGQAALEFNGMITLNETGAFLWKQLLNDVTKEQLLEAMRKEYDVSEEEAGNDIEEFLQILRAHQVL